ncbi:MULTISPECIES: sodium:solute symporter family protein [Lysinibacillus]|uniref:Sodium:solute symporter n=1 Tax=Lysinibacillus fusiformis TaxID=28031 RepID=A0A2I0UZV4_9BACI|nr:MULTISPECIES: sodium:solute symporter [Lysinibacillus]MEE3806494.1 sodium:solute symporter [Lysinibacillus fusiformis]PKU51502.1 sodium:solute symporter [Lysinibacillus fusiformis]WCH49933.1 sodium:solute symporter [Lysinibacillus sp. OF-1]
MTISIGIIAVFLGIALILGIMASRGKDMSLEQWSVGGRGFGSIFIFLLMAGEIYTTSAFLGISGWMYGKGGAAFYNIMMLNYVIAYWLTPKIWSYGKKHNLLSQSDFFEKAYKSKALGMVVAIVGLAALIPYLIIQLKGLGIIVSEASYGAIDSKITIWIGTIAMIVYVMVSGIHGSAWTAVIKDFLILGVVLFLGIYLPFHYYGGIQPMWEAIEATNPGFLTLPDSGLSASWYVSTMMLTSLGFYMWPHTFVATFSAKSGNALRRNAIILPIYALFILFVLFTGAAAILQVPNLSGGDVDLALFKISTQTFSPVIVGFIGAAGLLTAIVPGSLILMSAATLFAKNIIKPFRPQITDRQIGIIARYTVPLVALIALYFTFSGGGAITLLFLMGYGLVTQFAPAVVCSFMKKNPLSLQGVFAGIIVGVMIVGWQAATGANLSTLFPNWPTFIQDINIGFLALGVNIVVSLAVSAFTRKLFIKHDGASNEEIVESLP